MIDEEHIKINLLWCTILIDLYKHHRGPMLLIYFTIFKKKKNIIGPWLLYKKNILILYCRYFISKLILNTGHSIIIDFFNYRHYQSDI